MALKVLGQNVTALNTLTSIYTVPANKEAVLSSLVVCNTHATATRRFSAQLRIANAASATKQYFASLVTLQPGETMSLSLGMTMAATDQLYVNDVDSAGDLAFNLFGDERPVTP
jgi:hypothetical protein